MNYLAHIYLSGDDDFVKIGNFIADGIKGSKYKVYDIQTQKGILLHREIDTFTDGDVIVKRSKRRLNDHYNLYRGIIIDILYDHFLAKNWETYSTVPLEAYSQDFYALLLRNTEILPARIQHMMPYMIKDDWLTSYASLEGIKKVLALFILEVLIWVFQKKCIKKPKDIKSPAWARILNSVSA